MTDPSRGWSGEINEGVARHFFNATSNPELVSRTKDVATAIAENINRRQYVNGFSDTLGYHLRVLTAARHRDTWRHDLLQHCRYENFVVETDDDPVKFHVLNGSVNMFVTRKFETFIPEINMVIKAHFALCEIFVSGGSGCCMVTRSSQYDLNSVVVHVLNLDGEDEDDITLRLLLNEDGSVSFRQSSEEDEVDENEEQCEKTVIDCNTSAYVENILKAVQEFKDEEDVRQPMEDCIRRIANQPQVRAVFANHLPNAVRNVG